MTRSKSMKNYPHPTSRSMSISTLHLDSCSQNKNLMKA